MLGTPSTCYNVSAEDGEKWHYWIKSTILEDVLTSHTFTNDISDLLRIHIDLEYLSALFTHVVSDQNYSGVKFQYRDIWSMLFAKRYRLPVVYALTLRLEFLDCIRTINGAQCIVRYLMRNGYMLLWRNIPEFHLFFTSF